MSTPSPTCGGDLVDRAGSRQTGRRPPFADDRATYVRLAVSFTFFERILQTRFLPFRFRVLCLNFLRETVSM